MLALLIAQKNNRSQFKCSQTSDMIVNQNRINAYKLKRQIQEAQRRAAAAEEQAMFMEDQKRIAAQFEQAKQQKEETKETKEAPVKVAPVKVAPKTKRTKTNKAPKSTGPKTQKVEAPNTQEVEAPKTQEVEAPKTHEVNVCVILPEHLVASSTLGSEFNTESEIKSAISTLDEIKFRRMNSALVRNMVDEFFANQKVDESATTSIPQEQPKLMTRIKTNKTQPQPQQQPIEPARELTPQEIIAIECNEILAKYHQANNDSSVLTRMNLKVICKAIKSKGITVQSVSELLPALHPVDPELIYYV